LREELVLAVAQNASAQATAFEAEVKDKLEEAKETVSHKVAEVSQMAHSMAQFLTDAEVEQLLGEFSMDACWDQAVEAENLAQAKAYSTRLSDLAGHRERIEELHREIKKEQERIAIRSLIATQKALMMLEGMSLQVTLSGQSEKMRSFATTTLVNDLKDGFTGGAADAAEAALNVKKPILLSPIKGGM